MLALDAAADDGLVSLSSLGAAAIGASYFILRRRWEWRE